MEKKNSAGAFLTVKDELRFVPKPNKIIPWIQGVVENEGAVRAAGNTVLSELIRPFCMLFEINVFCITAAKVSKTGERIQHICAEHF